MKSNMKRKMKRKKNAKNKRKTSSYQKKLAIWNYFSIYTWTRTFNCAGRKIVENGNQQRKKKKKLAVNALQKKNVLIWTTNACHRRHTCHYCATSRSLCHVRRYEKSSCSSCATRLQISVGLVVGNKGLSCFTVEPMAVSGTSPRLSTWTPICGPVGRRFSISCCSSLRTCVNLVSAPLDAV